MLLAVKHEISPLTRTCVRAGAKEVSLRCVLCTSCVVQVVVAADIVSRVQV